MALEYERNEIPREEQSIDISFAWAYLISVFMVLLQLLIRLWYKLNQFKVSGQGIS